MIVNEISLVIQNIISLFLKYSFSFESKCEKKSKNENKAKDSKVIPDPIDDRKFQE